MNASKRLGLLALVSLVLPAALAACQQVQTAPVQGTAAPSASASSGASPAATRSETPGASLAAGATLSRAAWLVTIKAVEQPGTGLQLGSTVGHLDARGTWVVVYLRARNNGAQPATLRPGQFTLRDASGRAFTAEDSTEAHIWAEYHAVRWLEQPVAAGDTLDSALVCDVPPQASGFELEMGPG